MGESLALVGATGGAGATRLTVEFGATLTRAGRSVALLDAAYATQGLADYVRGRIDPDITAVVTGSAPLSSGLIDLDVRTPGRLAACPAAAPFDRLARAKTAEAAEQFESLVADATSSFDHVIVDTPPVAANQSIAAINAADRVALVTPATARGADAYARSLDRLTDIGIPPGVLVANGEADGGPVADADVAIPWHEAETPAEAPVCPEPDATFAPAVATAVETAVNTRLDLAFESDRGFEQYIPAALRNR